MPSAADPVNRPGLRGYAIQMTCFVIERVAGPAQHRRPVRRRAGWRLLDRAVIPRKATLEAPVLPANRRSRRQPPRPDEGLNTALGEPHPDPITGLRHRAPLREATPRTALVRAATSSSNALPAALGPTAPQICRSGSRHPPALAIATRQCSRPDGRLRATPSVGGCRNIGACLRIIGVDGPGGG